MARWRVPLEVLDFKGRFDMQVKQDGFRVELGDVERTLETMEGIRQAVVLQQRLAGHKMLSAYVVLAEHAQDIRARDIRNYAKESLPPYMVPSKITIVAVLPLNPYGKVDREALERMSFEDEVADGEIETEMSSIVKRMVRSLIHVSDLQADDDFFELGMSSLESARFIGLLMQRFGKKVTMDMLLENPTVAKVASMLQETKQTRPTLVDIAVMTADTLLADDIPVVPDWLADNEGRIFITGVTGFVGVHLLAQLLALPGVKQIACLARSRKGLSAQARVEHTLKRYDIWSTSQPHLDKLLILDGEMADENLGLGIEKFTWLTTWASVVFHVGAKVNFCEPYQSHFASNVLGTKHVLRLAALGRRKALHYMSSIDTWGPTALVLGTKRLEEDEGLHSHLTSLPYDTGYAHSQWVAEEMVRRTRDRGLPVAIYRPGFTIGDPATAMGNPDDFFARMIVGSVKIGFWPYLPDQRLEYVTVDYVCSALLHIASDTGNLGKSYSLVAPEHSMSVSIEGTGRMINEAGYAVKEVPYDEWVLKLRESDIDRNPLSPLMPLLEEPVLWELSRLQTSKHTPVYEAPNTVRALEGRDDIRYTPLSAGLLGRYLENWRRKGFYDV
ncbi:male sterility protein-domain-containing protein [Aspergillus multicolor]|uniref:male sterility protein-domain-containing protein n=1 Tax=Aspergillus multicolor TaxID=41759 RepID=UPI003CCD83A6